MIAPAGYPAPGDRIGGYLILRRIGVGGMGMVYAATHEGLARDVALKVIAPHLADDEEFRARFTREARALAALDSPHVVRVFDHGDVDGHLYIAAQLVPDGDLGSLLADRGAPPLPAALDLMAQVAAGLADAHRSGLVHRDIKPANVLVRLGEDRITAYLGDFGIARELAAAGTPTTRTVGTPSFMAPELHTGGAPSVASDVYSLGCLLWATVTGTEPYAGTSDYQIVQQHLEAPIPQLPNDGALETAVNRILRTAMAKEPGDRYPGAAAFRDDLVAALRGAPVAPAPPIPPAPPSPPTPPEPSTSRRTPVLAAVAVLVLAVAGGTWLALRDSDRDTSSGSSTTPPATSATTPTTTAPATPAQTPASSDPADRAKAIETLTALLEDEGLEAAVAACSAEGWVDAIGVQRLIEAGVLTEDLEVNTEDLEGEPDQEVLSAGTTATVACLSQ